MIQLSPLDDKRPKNKRLKPNSPLWLPTTPEDPGSSEDDTFPETVIEDPPPISPKYNPETSNTPFTFDLGETPNFV